MHLRPPLVAALALALGLGLTGCGADVDGARKEITKVVAPGSDWTPGGQGIVRFGEHATKDGTIWVVHDGSEGDDADHPTYEAGWEIVVKPGFEGNRCEQAARWLKKTGQGFTGKQVDGQTTATLTAIVEACLSALKPQAEGATSDTGFATWPALENSGYRFSSALGAEVSGKTMKLYAMAEAGPNARYGG